MGEKDLSLYLPSKCFYLRYTSSPFHPKKRNKKRRFNLIIATQQYRIFSWILFSKFQSFLFRTQDARILLPCSDLHRTNTSILHQLRRAHTKNLANKSKNNGNAIKPLKSSHGIGFCRGNCFLRSKQSLIESSSMRSRIKNQEYSIFDYFTLTGV